MAGQGGTPRLAARRKGDYTLQPVLGARSTRAGPEELLGNGKKGKVRVGLAGNGDSDMRLQALSPGRAVPADSAPIPKHCPSPAPFSSQHQDAEHRM